MPYCINICYTQSWTLSLKIEHDLNIVVITFPLQHNDVNRSVMLLSRMPLDSYIERVLFTEPYRPCAHCLIQGNIFAYCPSLKCF